MNNRKQLKKRVKKRSKVGAFKTVFTGKTFQVEQAPVTTASGKRGVFERVLRPSVVTILALDAKERLLLNWEYRHKAGTYTWRLPSGRIDEGETPAHAAQRELREETGFKAKTLKLFHLTDIGQSVQWKRYTYLAQGLSYAPLPPDEEEDIVVVPTPLKKAMRMVLNGTIQNETMAYLILKLYNSIHKIHI